MNINIEKLLDCCNTAIADCDNRIADVKNSIADLKVCWTVRKFISESQREMWYNLKIQNYENTIKMIQTEKIIYNALLKGNSGLFPKLLERYDELLSNSCEFGNQFVTNGLALEGDYLDYCKESVEQRNYISQICFVGKHRKEKL
jgi:hypothetical protein